MAKGVALPINAIIIMALGIIVVLGLAIFATGSIFGGESELVEQQVLADCCLRACRNVDFEGRPTDVMNELGGYVCATDSIQDWDVVSKYDVPPTDGKVTLEEVINAKVPGNVPAKVAFAQTLCGC